jgi:hypothetical protein
MNKISTHLPRYVLASEMERFDAPEALVSRSGFKLAVWIIGSLLATAVFGFVIGVAGASKGTSFDWETATVAATAFATTILAALTGTFAYTTVIAQQRSDRVLVAVRLALRHQEHEGGTISCNVTLRNVGAAPAAYITIKVESEDSARVPLVGQSNSNHFLGPGEETDVIVDLAIAARRSLPDDIETRVQGVCLNSASQPIYFLWQRYRWGGMSFLFKSKPWTLSNVVPSEKEIINNDRLCEQQEEHPNIVLTGYTIEEPDSAVGREVPTARVLYTNVGLAPAIHVTFKLVWFDSNNSPIVISESFRAGQIISANETGSLEGVLLVRGNIGDRERTELTVNWIDQRGRESSAMWTADRDGDMRGPEAAQH